MKYTHLLYTLLLCSAFIHASDDGGSDEESSDDRTGWVRRVYEETERSHRYLSLPPAVLALPPIKIKKYQIRKLKEIREKAEKKYREEIYK
ncbi:hypothetical protein EBQ93_02795, partial [bacterium]|nr:hypothetical protein [bacterium]